MKASIFVLVFSGVFLLTGFVNAYSEDGPSSAVMVIGPSESSSSSQGQALEDEASDSESPNASEAGINSTLIYEITGSRVGGTQVSQPVEIPSDGVVMFVDAGISRSFVLVSVDKDGRETMVLNKDPERAVGTRLPKGIYKVYPQDLDGAFPQDKLTAKVQVAVTENLKGGTK